MLVMLAIVLVMLAIVLVLACVRPAVSGALSVLF